MVLHRRTFCWRSEQVPERALKKKVQGKKRQGSAVGCYQGIDLRTLGAYTPQETANAEGLGGSLRSEGPLSPPRIILQASLAGTSQRGRPLSLPGVATIVLDLLANSSTNNARSLARRRRTSQRRKMRDII